MNNITIKEEGGKFCAYDNKTGELIAEDFTMKGLEVLLRILRVRALLSKTWGAVPALLHTDDARVLDVARDLYFERVGHQVSLIPKQLIGDHLADAVDRGIEVSDELWSFLIDRVGEDESFEIQDAIDGAYGENPENDTITKEYLNRFRRFHGSPLIRN